MKQRKQLKHEELWNAFWNSKRSSEAATKLIEAWMPLVHSILGRITICLPAHVQIDDLLQCAVLGLYESIERFDPTNGAGFSTYATRRIRGAIIDELRSNDHMSRTGRAQFKSIGEAIQNWTTKHGSPPNDNELAKELHISTKKISSIMESAHPWLSLDQVVMSGRDGQNIYLRDVLEDKHASSPDKNAIREDVRKALRKAYRSLSGRDQKILYLYYFEELRLSEIAELFELSQARICQIHGMIILKLRAMMHKEEYQMAS